MSSLFRNTAMDQALSPEKLNRQIKIITPPFIMVFAALLLVILTGIAWSVFVTIPVRLELKGVVFPQNGILTVVAEEEGFAESTWVKHGDDVKIGDLIAYIPQTDILRRIKSTNDPIELEQLRKEYHLKSMIMSPAEGQIISVVKEGEYLRTGEEIAKLVQESIYTNNQEITAFASQSEAKRLKKGMMVQISPDFAPREEYGYMEGVVTKIAGYPSTPEETIKRFGGFISEGDLSHLENMIEIKVSISADKSSKNFKRWSNPKGETLDIDVGTRCNIAILISRAKPVDLIFP
ncbi:MAG: HlyD family efflux transporter periplasmic adaptor subunit [Dehalobacterium sp.]